MKPSAHSLVAVVWDDAKATAVVEYDLNEVRTQFHRAARYTTYGLLLVDDEKGITLASEEGDDQNLRGLSFIPRPMIVEVVTLARPRTRKPRARRQAAAPRAAEGAPSPEAQGATSTAEASAPAAVNPQGVGPSPPAGEPAATGSPVPAASAAATGAPVQIGDRSATSTPAPSGAPAPAANPAPTADHSA